MKKQTIEEAKFKKGMKLTIASDIIDIGGCLIFYKGQKVTIEETLKDERKWSRFFNVYFPEKITGFKLKEQSGIWSTKTFNETLYIK